MDQLSVNEYPPICGTLFSATNKSCFLEYSSFAIDSFRVIVQPYDQIQMITSTCSLCNQGESYGFFMQPRRVLRVLYATKAGPTGSLCNLGGSYGFFMQPSRVLRVLYATKAGPTGSLYNLGGSYGFFMQPGEGSYGFFIATKAGPVLISSQPQRATGGKR